MSLVNDMLRDLDRRKRFSSGAAASVYSLDKDSEARAKNSWIILLLVAAGIVAGVIGGYMFFKQPANVDVSAVQVPETISQVASNQAGANENTLLTENATAQSSTENDLSNNSISIFENRNTADGFQIKIVSIYDFSYEVGARNEYGIEILLPTIFNVTHNDVKVSGFSFTNSAEGMSLSIDLNDKADFMVYEETNSENGIGKSLIIEAVIVEESSPLSLVDSVLISEAGQPLVNNSNEENQVVLVEPAVSITTPAAVIAENDTSIRTAREPSFEQRDLKVSQNAAEQIQRGQIMAAYEVLLAFVGENEEAHHSRATLATLLFAQQEYEQATVIVDQGLNIAPNYSAYKKIKARLFILNNEAQQATVFLSNYPPTVDADPEYFELLASAFQQSDQYGNAIETYQDLIRYDSTQARWWVGMGVSHEAAGNIDAALASYQAAMQSPSLESALRQYSQTRIRYLKN